MKNYTIKQYSKTDFNNWNSFVDASKNSTFLHNRNFMDYHSDRFEDFSLVVLDNEKWIAVLPANIFKNELFSHQGLTYGGLLYEEKLKLESVILIFQAILIFLNDNKIEKLHLKTIPSIYHQKPAEELNYALFLANAKIIRRDSLSVLDLSKKNILSNIRKRGIKKGFENDLKIVEENTFDLFWNEILIPNLELKFKTKPVHNLFEIKKLKELFPENIRQFNVYQNNKIVGGTTIFESQNVAHAQYISGNESLDFLFNYLINEVFKNKKYFDFGISNEQQGRKLNAGLSYFKESFGARTIVHDYYEIDTKNYELLNNVLIT